MMNKSVSRRRFLEGSASLSLSALPVTKSALFTIGSEVSQTAAAGAFVAADLGHPLLAPVLEHSLAVRCLQKPVSSFLMLDDMETDGGWHPSPQLKISYTTERSRSGKRSLRMTALLRDEAFIKSSVDARGNFKGDEAFFFGQPFSAFAIKSFERPQDWTAYNRLSLWCYLHSTVSPTTSISLQFLCAGAGSGPSDPLPIHFIGDLKPGEWNHLTWEISEYQRDKVVMMLVMKPCSGLPIATPDPSITFDLDELRLEKVEVEPVSSWKVTRGKIAYSHIGYRPGASKLAFCDEPKAKTFRVVNLSNGAVRGEYPVDLVENSRGHFTVLDFSAVIEAGLYRLECGDSKGEAFTIAENAWDSLLNATLNSFHGFRCGCSVLGSHDACHLDTFIEYKGERRCMAGGWHDAANNTQFADSTHLSIYALLRLYEELQMDPQHATHAAAALAEAKWGLDWSLRMRFAPGVRLAKNQTSYWTDNKSGTIDDVIQSDAGNDLRENIYAVVALSTAARVLQSVDARNARAALQAAEEDYAEFLPSVAHPIQPITYGDAGRGSWRDLAAYLAVCAVELFRATGKPAYRADALRFGAYLIALQEQRFIDGSPVTGYFYADAERKKIQREVYGGSDDSGFLALRALCEAFPEAPQWIEWYAGLLIYSEYFCREGSEASAPFHVIPTAVWRRSDLVTDDRPDTIGAKVSAIASPMFPTPVNDEVTRQQRLKMFEAGAVLAPNTRLRVFPIWYNHVQHGATTGQLNRAAGLGCAAAVRSKLDVAELTARQLQWVVGANPFSRSLAFGVGYDYWQNFTVDNVNFVGALGLGMNSYEADMPAWPNNAVFPYKEQWSYSTSRIALNLAQCAASAHLSGRAVTAITLREQRSGATTTLPSGPYKRSLPPGRYLASGGGTEWKLELVGGRLYRLDFEPQHAITLTLTHQNKGKTVTVQAEMRGAGAHELSMKAFNVEGGGPTTKKFTLKQGHVIHSSWHFEVIDEAKPWIAIVIPSSALDLRQEVFGRVGDFIHLS